MMAATIVGPTSSHDDDCLTLWPNKLVSNFSVPRILHNLYGTATEILRNDLKMKCNETW